MIILSLGFVVTVQEFHAQNIAAGTVCSDSVFLVHFHYNWLHILIYLHVMVVQLFQVSMVSHRWISSCRPGDQQLYFDVDLSDADKSEVGLGSLNTFLVVPLISSWVFKCRLVPIKLGLATR